MRKVQQAEIVMEVKKLSYYLKVWRKKNGKKKLGSEAQPQSAQGAGLMKIPGRYADGGSFFLRHEYSYLHFSRGRSLPHFRT